MKLQTLFIHSFQDRSVESFWDSVNFSDLDCGEQEYVKHEIFLFSGAKKGRKSYRFQCLWAKKI